MNLGLFGGSFDPVHLGHLMVAQAARAEAALDRLIFLPASRSPFKPARQLAPDARRTHLLQLALAGLPWCEVDDWELRRGGVSYTIDTAREFARRFPHARLFYLIGADNAAGLGQWREPDALAQLVEFLVIPRPGETPVLPAPFRGSWLQGSPTGISSTEIRNRVHQGLTISHLVPPAVAEAIRNYGLYSEPDLGQGSG
jgi:nicotinate-nucleotide adenylyltransferase